MLKLKAARRMTVRQHPKSDIKILEKTHPMLTIMIDYVSNSLCYFVAGSFSPPSHHAEWMRKGDASVARDHVVFQDGDNIIGSGVKSPVSSGERWIFFQCHVALPEASYLEKKRNMTCFC